MFFTLQIRVPVADGTSFDESSQSIIAAIDDHEFSKMKTIQSVDNICNPATAIPTSDSPVIVIIQSF
jgi:hypothetical protein